MPATPPSIEPASDPAPLPPQFADTAPAPTLLAVGAEAHLYRTHFLTPTRPCALKYRPPKTWRHPTLDARLARHRVLAEARVLHRCRRMGVPVPGVLALDWEVPVQVSDASEAPWSADTPANRIGSWLMMEWIDGHTVRRALDEWGKTGGALGSASGREDELRRLMAKIGQAVGALHGVGVVHGDLTTSNLMLRPLAPNASNGVDGEGPQPGEAQDPRPTLEGEVVLIDFGLATQTTQEEDRAVDLYVLERAFGSTHPTIEGWFQEALRAYGTSYGGGKIALKRLEDVRLRGRKKSMVG